MTCIFKFSNSKDRRLCRKIDLYRLKYLSTSTDVIGQYCMLTMSEGESSTVLFCTFLNMGKSVLINNKS